jgi:hypothetical protein
MTKQTQFPEIENRLEELKVIPPRDPQQAARGRSKFMNEAAQYRQAVSIQPDVRQKGWIFLANRKEKFAMNALVSLFLATALILGGGATAVAAQDDLPNQPLYPVKLWTENAKMAMTGDPLEQANLLMHMMQTRVEEMVGLAENGIPSPARVHERLREQTQQTLMLVTDMNDSDMTKTLLQLRERLQTQERIMMQLQTQVDADFDPLLEQTRLILQNRLHLVDQGLADPQGFRYMMTNQMQYGQDAEANPEPNQQGEPGFHQNDQGGQEPVEAGTGNGMKNPDNAQNGNGYNGSDNEQQGGQNPDSESCSGSNCSGGDGGGDDCSGSGCNDGHHGGHDGGNK